MCRVHLRAVNKAGHIRKEHGGVGAASDVLLLLLLLLLLLYDRFAAWCCPRKTCTGRGRLGTSRRPRGGLSDKDDHGCQPQP